MNAFIQESDKMVISDKSKLSDTC